MTYTGGGGGGGFSLAREDWGGGETSANHYAF